MTDKTTTTAHSGQQLTVYDVLDERKLPLSLQQTPAIDNAGDLVAVIAELLAFSGVQLVDVRETAALVKVGGRCYMVGVAETK